MLIKFESTKTGMTHLNEFEDWNTAICKYENWH
jgi:hypothetical protein